MDMVEPAGRTNEGVPIVLILAYVIDVRFIESAPFGVAIVAELPIVIPGRVRVAVADK